MTNQKAKTIPKPGSDAAIKRGCKCPVLDNAHGKGVMGLGKDYWITEGCPLHDKEVKRD